MTFNIKLLVLPIIMVLFCISPSSGQYVIESSKGYSPQIGTTVAMMEDLKQRVTKTVEKLSDKETDYLMDEKAYSIETLVLHLASAEKYYQLYTFENQEFNKEEQKKWGLGLDLNEQSRKSFKNKPISYYLNI